MERCGAFLLKRVQKGAEKRQTAAPNGFSLFVMRLLLLLLPEHVVAFSFSFFLVVVVVEEEVEEEDGGDDRSMERRAEIAEDAGC